MDAPKDTYPPTIVWRHRKENLKKCSLRGLEARADMLFLKYPTQPLPPLEGYVLLCIDAPPLEIADSQKGLLLLDGTWRYSQKMAAQIPPDSTLEMRSIPQTYRTAYPRRQEDCSEPDLGLASVEALYVAYHILRRDCAGLLDSYHWADSFLKKNALV